MFVWALRCCKYNEGHFGHTEEFAWMQQFETKCWIAEARASVACFYLWAEISLSSCFHLHHFACPIELDWLPLQEGDGHHKKAADGWSEIKCKQRMCTNPPIRPPLSVFVKERGIITLACRLVAMWEPLEESGLRLLLNGDPRSVLNLPANKTLVYNLPAGQVPLPPGCALSAHYKSYSSSRSRLILLLTKLTKRSHYTPTSSPGFGTF